MNPMTEPSSAETGLRAISPYVVSLAALPAFLMPAASVTHEVQLPRIRLGYESVSASEEGEALERRIAAVFAQIEQTLELSDVYLPDLALDLIPQNQTHHRGVRVDRVEPLPFTLDQAEISDFSVI
jgi:hypothetical protein